jgi:hypothetical protein
MASDTRATEPLGLSDPIAAHAHAPLGRACAEDWRPSRCSFSAHGTGPALSGAAARVRLRYKRKTFFQKNHARGAWRGSFSRRWVGRFSKLVSKSGKKEGHAKRKWQVARELPGGARRCPELQLPGAARSCPELPGATRNRPELHGAARSCPELPGASRSCPELPGDSHFRDPGYVDLLQYIFCHRQPMSRRC